MDEQLERPSQKAPERLPTNGNLKDAKLYVPERLSKRRYLPTVRSLLVTPGIPLIHRDLSWLQFNERVLEQARPGSKNLPLERVKFLAISSTNLDEFFLIRMSSLIRDVIAQVGSKDKVRHLARLRDLILENVARFVTRQSELLDLLSDELQSYGIYIVKDLDEGDPAFEIGKTLFESRVLPRLKAADTFTLQKVTKLKNLQMALVFPDGLWFKIPRSLPPMVYAQKKDTQEIYFFFLDTLILTFMARTFRGHEAPGMLRISRDADVTTDLREEGIGPTPSLVRDRVLARDTGRPVRLQYVGNLSDTFLEELMSRLHLIQGQIIPAPSTLCLHGLWTVANESAKYVSCKEELTYPPLPSVIPKEFTKSAAIFERIKLRDIFLHHPYDSFDVFLQWIQQSCEDSQVVSIELTIYRIDLLSPLIGFLKEAARTKRVRILIELRARFDELNNLSLAEELSKAGVEVHFGYGKLKVHAKVALVTREEEGKRVYYTHLSTGNYNAKTAKIYDDLAVITANQEFGEDARTFLDAVVSGQIPKSFKRWLVAPTRLHRKMLSLIEEETRAALENRPARIVAKVNALVDEEVIGSLYRASQAGVKIDLIVRGACSLIPQVPKLSENIRVISIVDRFLEHSRLYYFESSRSLYLSSADWMPRNFFGRFEIAYPILNERVFDFVKDVLLATYLADTVKARELTAQGIWKKRAPKRGGKRSVRAQFVFSQIAAENYVGTPLEWP